MLPLLVLLGTIAGAWYLLIVRPQKEQQTRHGELVERLQVGDHVLTVGGIYGQVVAVEGPSVVLELAPGLTSRIATDGIARIVHAGDGALPSTPTPTPVPSQEPPTALDTAMHQHPHHDQQQAPQHAAPQYHAPAQPWIAQPAQPPVQLAAPAPPAAAPMHHEPRPWGDLAPVNQPPVMPQYSVPQYAVPHYAAPQHAQQPVPAYAAAPMHPGHAAPQHAVATAIPSPPPLPMPLVRPFAEPTQAAVQPVAHPMQAHPAPMQYVQPPVHPGVQPALVPAHLAQQPAREAAAPTEPLDAAPRRHSRAPQGMGSSLRLDDPSLRDTMVRARDERTELADEYRKLTAPLVDLGTQADPVQVSQQLHAEPGTAFVGHDPNGMPLFAAPGSPTAHPVSQYPGPARPDAAGGMPRPVVQAPHAAVDPALSASAFQRRAPYAPDPALQSQGAAQAQPALA